MKRGPYRQMHGTTAAILGAVASNPGATTAQVATLAGCSKAYARGVLVNHIRLGNVKADRDWNVPPGILRHTLIRMPDLPVTDRVYRMVADRPHTRAQLATRLQCSPRTVGQALAALLDSGRIVAGPGSNGKIFVYALPTLAQQAAK